jgi:hypothetical protein
LFGNSKIYTTLVYRPQHWGIIVTASRKQKTMIEAQIRVWVEMLLWVSPNHVDEKLVYSGFSTMPDASLAYYSDSRPLD